MGTEGSIGSVLGGERAAALVAEVIGAASEGIALLGPDGRVLLANHAACRLLGREPEEISGLALNDVLEGVDLDGEDPRPFVLTGARQGAVATLSSTCA